MSLLNNKKNNSGIRQLNQIDNQINNLNHNKDNIKTKNDNIIKKSKEIKNEVNGEEEEEEEEEEEGEEPNNINEDDLNDDNNENEEEEDDEEEENLSLLESYKYKLNFMENIYLYPRPKTNFILYKNKNNNNNFISNPNNTEIIPSVRAYFTNIEELNSSIKLIRPSQYIIPYDYK